MLALLRCELHIYVAPAVGTNFQLFIHEYSSVPFCMIIESSGPNNRKGVEISIVIFQLLAKK